ncbi:glycosyltransferase [Myxacorys almedinensis]|uniref:Glycosyltransferase n=1 Tax=Myxacorys almedinensis A TaxID=2690445 RepID=A0A8J7Z208_9CYAN|nr:glycosyltransferase [Myxacorys almedinensis]NDJ16346.1 glycosyltransferase [Myxacorys almedinensis A]
MQILFLDQSGKLGGAELSLLDIAKRFPSSCLVGLFADGAFRQMLEKFDIPVQILGSQPWQVRKDSGLVKGLSSVGHLIPLVHQVASLSRDYDVIYANTQKALVVGAIASLIARRPLIYHLRDILSTDHFSRVNLQVAIAVANCCAIKVIANSEATREAFINAGGWADRVEVIYNGFEPTSYKTSAQDAVQLRQQFDLEGRFVVGHFSRLSPWKGQHILLEALAQCPADVVAVFVGEALFQEHDYVRELHQCVQQLGLSDRVRFLGFRSDVPPLMAMCDVVTHTSTSPEPFGRVIVEAMLCEKPVIAAAAGGVLELVSQGQTGWLVPPDDPASLVAAIGHCRADPDRSHAIAHQAYLEAIQRFDLDRMQQQIVHLLGQVMKSKI